jgi:hypothetical protein
VRSEKEATGEVRQSKKTVGADGKARPSRAKSKPAAPKQTDLEEFASSSPAAIMRDPLRSSIEALLPPDALAVAKAAEESGKAMIEGLAGTLE